MKRNLFVVFSLLLSLTSFAQFNGSGYYRIKNVASERYITVRDNRGSVNIGATSADLGAVELYKGFENVVSDPSSILYIDQTPSGFKFYAQGTDTYEIIGYYLQMKQNSDGSYKAYQGNSMMVMYLGDKVTSSAVKGSLSTNAKGEYRDWYILPFNASSNDNYFGINPDINAKGDYYASFYASFPFTTLSKGLKAFYIVKVDRDMAVYREITDGIVPAATPVFFKCVSDKPVDNKLDIIANSVTLSGNQLCGVYFDNNNSAHYNRTAYDANTMRVLGTTSDGQLAYVKANLDFLPANKSYLNVPNDSPDVIKLLSESDYEKVIQEEAKTYVLTFKIDGDVISTQSLKVGDPISIPDVPVKQGYTFCGWGDVPETMPAENLTFEGTYSINSYTITFKIGDEVISSESLAYGAEIDVPTAPAKEGYTFSGWGDVPVTMPAEDLTFVGTYTINTYTLTFMIGDEVIFSESLAYGTEINVPTAPVKEGYTFSGWGDVPATMPAKDLTIIGMYIEKAYYTVTFKVDDEIISMQSLVEGDSIYVPDVPVREGYTFSGWGDVPATMPAKSLTFEATYKINTYTLTFKIGNEVISTKSLAYGAQIEAPVAPTKMGYTFSGWGDLPATMPAQDLIIEGSYIVNSYTLKFMVGKDVLLIETLPYGAPIDVPTAPAKEGYTFGGWGDVPATMPAENLVIEGLYNVNYYSITYKIDEEVIQVDSVAYGASIEVPKVPAKEGYTFGGWGDVPATVPAHDLIFDGSYIINYYTLTFVLDDEVISVDTLAYGSTIEVPEVLDKEGYNFSGWGDVPTTMPAKNLTIVGMYIEEDYYTITFKVDDEIISMQSLTEGDSIYVPEAPVKEGHAFDGWGDVPATMPAKNLIFIGVYSPKNYTISFEIGNQVIAKFTLPYGAYVEAPEAPVKEGHTFDRWDDIPATMPAYDLTCKGYYHVNSYTIQYKVDGQDYQKETLEYGEFVFLIAEPQKEGRTFSGWSDAPKSMPAYDLVVEGSFMYYVYYYANDVLVHTAELYFGETIPAYVYKPANESDSFLGWLGDTYDTMPAHDITYIANIEQSVEIITADNLVDIYTITGAKIMTKVSLNDAKAVLKRGIYIVNGKKMIIE